MGWLLQNYGVVATVALAVSEALTKTKVLKENSILEVLESLLKAVLKK